MSPDFKLGHQGLYHKHANSQLKALQTPILNRDNQGGSSDEKKRFYWSDQAAPRRQIQTPTV